MKIRAIVVDDEPLACERIQMLLANETDVDLAAVCGGGPEALEAIRSQHPDLMFLDVQMPEMDGFEVLKRIPQDQLPVVIFTTAYDQHALKAFEAHALDYLLKPFKPARFQEALKRARELIQDRRNGQAARGILELIGRPSLSPAAASQSQYLTRISIKNDDRVHFIKVDQVDCIEAAGNYVVVHSGKENHVLRETLSALETQLDPEKFLRVSRAAIVNLDKVKELQPMFKGEHVVVLANGKQIAMTRGLREVERALKYS